jgi:2-C-methyl-D-erythritol 4-phosphate cytidylyltransferase
MKNVVIISAGGQGKRMGRPKQFIEVAGKPILEWTISVFQKCDMIDEIILVVNEDRVDQAKKFNYSKIVNIVVGGEARQDSVRNGLKVLSADTEIVAIHDGARPMITTDIIENAIVEAKESGAAVVGVPVCDTIKRVTSNELRVTGTVDRSALWRAQTPQVFRKDIITKAYQQAEKVTDDSALVEKMGVPVKMVIGSYQNIKITTPFDLEIVERILDKGGIK